MQSARKGRAPRDGAPTTDRRKRGASRASTAQCLREQHPAADTKFVSASHCSTCDRDRWGLVSGIREVHSVTKRFIA